MSDFNYRIQTAIEKNLTTGFPITVYRVQIAQLRMEDTDSAWVEWTNIWTYYDEVQAKLSLEAWNKTLEKSND